MMNHPQELIDMLEQMMMRLAQREEELVYTVSEAAERLKMSRNQVYELIRRGEIPAIRLGGAIRIPRRRLEEWLNQVEVKM